MGAGEGGESPSGGTYHRIARKTPTTLRQKLAVLADRQHGVVSRPPTASDRLQRRRDRSGRSRWATTPHLPRRLCRRPPAHRRTSAVDDGALACGKGAVISHLSAGALLGLLGKSPVVIDVFAPGDHGRHIDDIYLHRVRPPRLEETGTFERIPCTSPARTLVDLAGVVGEWTLRSAFERAAAQRRSMLDIPAIERSSLCEGDLAAPSGWNRLLSGWSNQRAGTTSEPARTTSVPEPTYEYASHFSR